MSSTTLKKRSHAKAFPAEPAAAPKKPLASIFAPSKFSWLDRNAQYWCGKYGDPVGSSKIACFDLDGTLTVRNKTKGYPYVNARVPSAVRDAHANGATIYIVTNQGLREDWLERWRDDVKGILTRLNVPCHLLVACAYNGFRKPNPRLFEVIEQLNGQPIDKEDSFYVGDAAGRTGDHHDSDLKWALNVGLPFKTPEQYFLKENESTVYRPSGFDVKQVLASTAPLHTPSNTPLVPPDKKQELVIFVGCPAAGKTSFYRQHLEPAGYARVNRDALGTHKKCHDELEKLLVQGKSIVIDNTSPSVDVRASYIALAQKHEVPCRAFFFTTSQRHAWHNNLVRAYGRYSTSDEPNRKGSIFVADNGYSDYLARFQKPSLDEGIDEIKRITPQMHFTSPEQKAEYMCRWELTRTASKWLEKEVK